jgi:hypothetical protein
MLARPNNVDSTSSPITTSLIFSLHHFRQVAELAHRNALGLQPSAFAVPAFPAIMRVKSGTNNLLIDRATGHRFSLSNFCFCQSATSHHYAAKRTRVRHASTFVIGPCTEGDGTLRADLHAHLTRSNQLVQHAYCFLDFNFSLRDRLASAKFGVARHLCFSPSVKHLRGGPTWGRP